MHLLNYMYTRKTKQARVNISQKYTRLLDAPVLDTIRVVRTAADRSIYVKGALAWNQLPAGVRNMQSYAAFKFYQKRMVKNQPVEADTVV